MREIVRRVGRVVDAVFEDLKAEGKLPAATATGSCEGFEPTQVGVDGNAARGVEGRTSNGKATDLGEPAAGFEGGMQLDEVHFNGGSAQGGPVNGHGDEHWANEGWQEASDGKGVSGSMDRKVQNKEEAVVC